MCDSKSLCFRIKLLNLTMCNPHHACYLSNTTLACTHAKMSSECPKMPQACQEKMRGGFQNMWQVTVTGRLTPTGRLLVCDDDRRGLKAEGNYAWETSRMPLNSQAGGIYCLAPTVPRWTSKQRQKVPWEFSSKAPEGGWQWGSGIMGRHWS